MGSSDITKAVIIVSVFAIIQLSITLSISIEHIKKNWDKYKCNPGIIPFAGIFDHDPLETFNQCVQTTMANFMSTFLGPFWEALSSFAETGMLFASILEMLKNGLNLQQFNMFEILSDMGNRVKRLVTEMNSMFITVVDVFGKLSSTITVIYYILISAINTGKAMWDELPGTVIRFVVPGV